MNYFSSNIRLLRKRKDRTQEEIAAATGLKRTTVNALENSISQPSVQQLQSFSKFFGIAIDTLININLSRLSESQFTDLQNGFDVFIRGTNLRVIATTVDQGNHENIEFVSEKAKAGYATQFADPEYIGSLPVFQLPFLSSDKKYRAFSISGDSMLPIPDGSVVIGEFLQDFYDIKDGNAYVIVTRDEGILFKIAENRLHTNQSLLLISLNSEYKPYEMKAMEIREVWKFTCYFTTEIPEPETDIRKLMHTVKELKAEFGRHSGAGK